MVRTIILGGVEIKLAFERAFKPWRDIVIDDHKVINWHPDDPDWAIAAAILCHAVDVAARKNPGDNVTINFCEWILLRDKILFFVRDFAEQCNNGGDNA